MKRLSFIVALLISLNLTLNASAEELKSGEIFQDCDDCPEMVVLPSGNFRFGNEFSRWPKSSNSFDEAVYADMQKKMIAMRTKRITVEGFAIGKYEVTYGEYMACVDAGGCTEKPLEKFGPEKRLPAVGITWPMAQDYVRWLSEKTGRKYRLPSSTEWEYAAKAGTHTPYWWGADMEDGRALCKTCFKNPEGMKGYNPEKGTFEQPYAVGYFQANPFGLYDMLSNVSEWVQDCLTLGARNVPEDGTANEPQKDCEVFTSEEYRKFNGFRTIRGGNYAANLSKISVDGVSANTFKRKTDYIGFRLAAEIK